MPTDDWVRLRHMLEAAQAAVQAAEGRSRSDLDADQVWMLGLVKCIEIIGEAAARISESTRVKLPQIPWTQMIGMRNRLVHVYFDVDRDLVWDTIIIDLPLLIEQLEKVPEKEPKKSC